jgi:hypothetical protein
MNDCFDEKRTYVHRQSSNQISIKLTAVVLPDGAKPSSAQPLLSVPQLWAQVRGAEPIV